ncbi:MAG: hypothetical protein AB1480_16950 [Nitrospirota bacterium]
MRIHKLSNGKYAGLFNYFKSEFLPEDKTPPSVVMDEFLKMFPDILAVKIP